MSLGSALLELPYICEAAVVGLEDAEWGESVAAALVVTSDVTDLSLERVRRDGKALMAPYKLPKTIKIVESLPRNAMGKVEKSKVKPLFL
jgi:acyl-coenzyme A synthetase/AMP-(fatty) acid ligase